MWQCNTIRLFFAVTVNRKIRQFYIGINMIKRSQSTAELKIRCNPWRWSQEMAAMTLNLFLDLHLCFRNWFFFSIQALRLPFFYSWLFLSDRRFSRLPRKIPRIAIFGFSSQGSCNDQVTHQQRHTTLAIWWMTIATWKQEEADSQKS